MLYEVITILSNSPVFAASRDELDPLMTTIEQMMTIRTRTVMSSTMVNPLLNRPDARITSYNVCYTKLLRFALFRF